MRRHVMIGAKKYRSGPGLTIFSMKIRRSPQSSAPHPAMATLIRKSTTPLAVIYSSVPQLTSKR